MPHQYHWAIYAFQSPIESGDIVGQGGQGQRSRNRLDVKSAEATLIFNNAGINVQLMVDTITTNLMGPLRITAAPLTSVYPLNYAHLVAEIVYGFFLVALHRRCPDAHRHDRDGAVAATSGVGT
jgi:hypothetical protein